MNMLHIVFTWKTCCIIYVHHLFVIDDAIYCYAWGSISDSLVMDTGIPFAHLSLFFLHKCRITQGVIVKTLLTLRNSYRLELDAERYILCPSYLLLSTILSCC
jgi:hypothetical protein